MNKYKNNDLEDNKDDYIDKILIKINEIGYENLSDEDKNSLSKYIEECKINNINKNIEKLYYHEFNRKQHRFETGDKIKLINKKQGKLSKEILNFLLSKKYFIVKKVISNGKLDIGYKMNNKIYYFSSDRFAHYKDSLNKLNLS